MDRHFGIRALPPQLLKIYLSNRWQFIKLNNFKSKMAQISCGVPKRSSLGPLLFLLNISDLPQASLFDTTLFADDTSLTLSDKSLVNLEIRVNNELKQIDTWLKNNKLSLNY